MNSVQQMWPGERISKFIDRSNEIIYSEEKKETMKKTTQTLGDPWDTSMHMHCRRPRRGRERGIKNIWRNNSKKTSQMWQNTWFSISKKLKKF